jgi:serine/threonine-protein kinase
MSPEQAREKGRQRVQVDGRSDLFSLGIVIYEMLTGKLPFEDLGEMIDPAYVPMPPRQLRPSIPQALEDVVMRALAKESSRRFETAAEMRHALERVPMPFDWPAAVRRVFAVGAVGVTLTACLGVGGLGAMIARDVLSTTPTSIPTSPPATETATITQTVAHTATPAPTVTPAGTQVKTSTPAPTTTPTPTPVPTRVPTATPSSTGALIDTPVSPASSFGEDS